MKNLIQYILKKIRKNTSSKSREGFTVIELLAYLAIFSSVSVVAILSLTSSMQSFSKLHARQEVISSARSSLVRLVYEIKRAKAIDQSKSHLGTNPGKLVLQTTDATGNDETVTFEDLSGELELSVNGNDQGVTQRSPTLFFVLLPLSMHKR
jgi:type II secretory pathway pseudopilin PulG